MTCSCAHTRAAAREEELVLSPVSDGFTEPGCGVRGTLSDGRVAAVGKLDWVLDQVRRSNLMLVRALHKHDTGNARRT